jgi:FtsZ-interacting cell division protein ZipA
LIVFVWRSGGRVKISWSYLISFPPKQTKNQHPPQNNHQQVEPTKVTEGISNSMKERLAREASTGLDPDAKQTNVLLYVIAAVAVLVLLGGQGILY